MKNFLSRKFIAMIVGAIVVPFLQAKGASPETIDWILTMILGYIGVQGTVDAMAAFRAKPVV